MIQSRSDYIIQEKKLLLKSRLKWYALSSGAVGAAPVPGVSMTMDFLILVRMAKDQREVLGLNDNGLQQYATSLGITVDYLKRSLQEPLLLGTFGTFKEAVFE